MRFSPSSTFKLRSHNSRTLQFALDLPCLCACTRPVNSNLLSSAHTVLWATIHSNGVDSQIERRTSWRGGKWRRLEVLEGSQCGRAGMEGGNLQWRRNKFPLWPTCHVNFEFLRPIMIPSPPFMSLNFGTFPWFCTVV